MTAPEYSRVRHFCRLDKLMVDAYDNGCFPTAGLRRLHRQAWLDLPANVRRFLKP